jgi:N-acetylmuramoyl-L-alanine amidase
MARMPAAQWLGAHGPGKPMTRWDIVCIHTIGGGTAPAHAAHFSTKADGGILQSRDTRFQSGANKVGNPRIIAIENEDLGPAFGKWKVKDGHAVPAFTAAQIEANAQICAWANRVHGVPLVACPDSRSTSRGIAYHRQGIDGNWSGYAFTGRISGGEVWTDSRGKVCPGDRRIAQIPAIIARAKQIASGQITPTATDWFDMATQAELEAALRSVLAEQRITLDWDGSKHSFYEALSFIHFNAADGSFIGDVPATSTRERRRGTPTSAKEISNAVAGLNTVVKEAGREIGLTPAQIDALAASVAAKMRP